MIIIEIPGPVQPKQRPRFGYRKVYTPSATSKYEEFAGFHAKQAMRGLKPFEGYISLVVHVLVECPKSFSKLKISRCLCGDFFPTSSDLDNQIKILADSFNGIVWIDDRQIVHIEAIRSYAEQSKCVVKVREIKNISEVM